MSLSRRHIEAVKCLTIGRDTVRAERLWREIIAEDSCYAPALYKLSQLSRVPRSEVLGLARRAYEADSLNKWYCENYGMALMRHGLMDEALPVYKRLMALDNSQPSTYYYLAYIYATKRMPFAAIAVLDSADMRIGRNSYLASFKQSLLIETMQYERAIDIGRSLVEENPYDIDALVDLAKTYDVAGRDSLAYATFEQAYQLDTTRLETVVEALDYHISRGNNVERFRFEEKVFASDRFPVDVKLERIDIMMKERAFYADNYFRVGRLISMLAIRYPTDRQVIRTYTTHLCSAGMYDEAREYLSRHLDDENVVAEDYEVLIIIDTILERDDLVEQDLERAVEQFKDDLNLMTMYAQSKYLHGHSKQAIALMRKAFRVAQTNEDKSLCLGRIGDYYHENKRDARAFKYYDKALAYNAENVEVLNNYAYFLSLRDERLEEALAMSQLAITLEENNYNYIDTYAWVLHRLGRNEEAKKYMRQALSLSRQSDANLLMHYGDILWALGEEFMAETYWQKAVENGYDADEMKLHIAIKMLESTEFR